MQSQFFILLAWPSQLRRRTEGDEKEKAKEKGRRKELKKSVKARADVQI